MSCRKYWHQDMILRFIAVSQVKLYLVLFIIEIVKTAKYMILSIVLIMIVILIIMVILVLIAIPLEVAGACHLLEPPV